MPVNNNGQLDSDNNEKLFLRRKHYLTTCLNRSIKRAHKRLIDRQIILKKCQEWEKVAHIGQLLQSNLFRIDKGASSIQVVDWKQDEEQVIPLDPLVEPKLQVASYFKQSRKLRLGEKHAERQLTQMEIELAQCEEQRKELESILLMADLEAYCQRYKLHWNPVDTSIALKSKEVPKPYKLYHSEAGMEIWVGKSAKDNDQMTFHYANGSDWWFHAADYPGSHVVLRFDKRREPDRASIEDAAELSLRFSKVKGNHSGDVTQTQVKWLKRVKGHPGRVMLSQSKVLRITLNEARWLRLKNRQ